MHNYEISDRSILNPQIAAIVSDDDISSNPLPVFILVEVLV